MSTMIFQNAAIVGVNVEIGRYLAQEHPRGSVQHQISTHTLAEFSRNPHRWLGGYESPESKSKEFGDLIDCLALTPASFFKRYAIPPVTYVNKDGKECKWREDERVPQYVEWVKNNKGKQSLSAALNGKAHAAVERLRENERIAAVLDSGQSQVWCKGEYQDKATGLVIPVRCLLDKVPGSDDPLFSKCIVDLKTTKNASPRRFARDAWEYRYHVQAAWGLDLYSYATLEDRNTWLHIAQENFPPYEARMPLLAGAFIEAGRTLYQAWLRRYCQCLATNVWPGYDDPAVEWPTTEPEEWMLAEAMDAIPPLVEEDDEDEEDEEEQVGVTP